MVKEHCLMFERLHILFVMRFILLFLVFFAFFNNAYGMQVKDLANNESTSANISRYELTRIFVDKDRIQSVRGVSGAYTIKNDNAAGDIYIKPTYDYQEKPFNIFITTENGGIFSLLLIPRKVPSDNIMIKLGGVVSKEAEKWEKSSNYEATLTSLIAGMVNDEPPACYETIPIFKAKKEYLGSIATLTLKTVYRGANLSGEEYLVTNTTNNPITVSEREFYRPTTRAIALDKFVVPAHQSTTLYMVMSN